MDNVKAVAQAVRVVGEGSGLREARMLGLVAVLAPSAMVCASLGVYRAVHPLAVILGLFIPTLFGLVHILIRRQKGVDPCLLPAMALLSVLGLTEIFRLRPDLAVKQAMWILGGSLWFVAILRWPYPLHRLEKYRYTYGAAAFLLLLATLAFGVEVGGARSWLAFGWVRFQPSEVVKLLLVVSVAASLSESARLWSAFPVKLGGFSVPHPGYGGPVVAMWAVTMLLVVFQKDLGAALLYYGVFVSMVYVATGRSAYVVTGLVLGAIGAVLAYFLFAHVRARIDIWLSPWDDMDGRGYQLVQSLFAVASGGLFGRGPGFGYPGFIPAAITDFMFPAIVEEFGILGGFAALASYSAIVAGGFAAAARARDQFIRLMAVGLSSLMALQAFVISAGSIGLVPLTGITLPFASYGGTSVVVSFMGAGLLARLEAETLEIHEDASASMARAEDAVLGV